MRFVIVTGLSGGGKATALKMLEDMGFFCVDNLPISLISKFAELLVQPNGEVNKVALGLDVRTGNVEELPEALSQLKSHGYNVEVLFMECSEDTLIRRYKESRRSHPCAPDGRVEDGIRKERRLLEEIKRDADYIIDSSNLLTRELKAELERIFIRDEEYTNLMVTVLSFGYKHGIPVDADLVFDVRFLPNPFYVEELRHSTGLDPEVREYVMQFPEAGEFLDRLEGMLTFLIPNYVKEGKTSLVVAIGCTGGKHRSVTLAGEIYERLKDKGHYGIKLSHRDVKAPGT
ncbi:MAG: RNase adapter RapZ [Lachnospiraceae bacterium]|nr:RNase adapter RapZ [Lachnospiraceae bacterium]